ncbi:hypothetical protein GCG54_00014048 [Colletotrichum gloeosporioides]|uniref:Uncharacterized protein n=1 Tax=Colletotrichum gloeosporioides TaxID=474922 RepID=A0A8H4CTM4_COLGL|nr:uncharacterized protein GCG54_00014048 [Colletotrichum gloeosporioides]KAF3809835.1 hypothetical protein GCG54_00014048 [Colletotrichum gloeosporioides]
MNAQQGWEMQPLWAGSSTPAWERYETFADRWSQLCYNMKISQVLAIYRYPTLSGADVFTWQHHKIMVRSMLAAEWTTRLVGAPIGERKLKMCNKSVNTKRDIQNKVGRDVLNKANAKLQSGTLTQGEGDQSKSSDVA